MTVLDTPSPRLAHALDATIIANDERHPVRRGMFGFERGMDGWFAFIGHIAKALRGIATYSIIDLGCNVGAKAPFIAGWGCLKYLGLDYRAEHIAVARQRWSSGVCKFAVRNIVTEPLPDIWPEEDRANRVVYISYVLQHLPLCDKLAVLTKVHALKPDLFIIVDHDIHDKPFAVCEAEYEDKLAISMGIPLPLCELRRVMDGYTIDSPEPDLWLLRREP